MPTTLLTTAAIRKSGPLMLIATLLTILLTIAALNPALAERADDRRNESRNDGREDSPQRCEHTLVSVDILREVLASIEGYDYTKSPNQARFVADILTGLADHPELKSASTLQIQPRRFFDAWLQVTGMDADQSPTSVRKAHQHGQRFVIDTRPRFVITGEAASGAGLGIPKVLSVHVSWPDSPEAPDEYTYTDRLSDPEVRMRHERVITYQLLDFGDQPGDMTAYENMSGVYARPISGALGALFKILGMTEILSSRYAIAEDQTQVNRSKVRKLFTFTAVTTIAPEGKAQRGIPDDRDDLRRLAEPLETDYELSLESPPPSPCPVG